jgi:biopolymer transport protein ExbD
MSRFKKKQSKASAAISTASLPDIVFMLLFFFMVVTKLRQTEVKVAQSTPAITELTKLEEKSLVNFIMIGKPVQKYQAVYGTKPRLQLGDKLAEVVDIPLFLEKHKSTVPESRQGRITCSLKIDGDVTMGIVEDVKTMLRKSGQLRVNYSAKKRDV